MPSLTKPSDPHSITLPPRQATLAAETDVLVVGGGPAGLGAALGARKAGAEVILVERYGFLGGNATASLVMPLMSFHTQREQYERSGLVNLMPDDHGPGEPTIAGALQDFVTRLIAAGGAVAPSQATGYTVPFDPELFKTVALQMLDEAGVKFLFHAFASDVIGASSVDGVVFETKSGPLVIKAKTVIDATGDGDIAARAGAPFQVGRDLDGLVQPMTLMFRIADFEKAAFENYVREHPGEWRGVHGLWDLVRKATEAGDLDLPREDVLFFGSPHARELSVNSTRVTRVLSTDVFDLSRAEFQSRMQMNQLDQFFRKYVPGFENSYVMQAGSHVGVRESRRITGEYELTAADIVEAHKFDDVIARGSYPVDIHNPEGKGTVIQKLPEGEAYDIPLRSLIPQRVENLLVAGRCISGTHEAHSSYRVMPISMATGQAAGVAGALAAKYGKAVRDVAALEVQQELLMQGANLGDRLVV